MAKRNEAVKELKLKSKMVHKAMEPRNAYRYIAKSPVSDMNVGTTRGWNSSPSQLSINAASI